MNKSIQQILTSYWGYPAFRTGQESIIDSVLSGKDTLAIMPTGGGKSICYQVPGLAREGLCLVVSPLIALMKDQVAQLRKRNITAFSIQSGLSRKEVINILELASSARCKFLYVSPERISTALFKEYLPGLPINLIAIDEAHCISQWGYDFRPSYLKIAELRKEIPNVPVLALTASATETVQADICARLSLSPDDKWNTIQLSFERPNLSYSVQESVSKPARIREVLSKVNGTAIVYCRSRKRTKELSGLLSLEGISSHYYHAGLDQDTRNRIQDDWIANRIRVIVCTNAFGMGIDKPDVRLVIHADTPDCLENYYQEAGRAGRDGKTAYALLLHGKQDLDDLKEMPAIRFPSLEQIRQVYDSICQFLQIHTGSGENEFYAFDLDNFLRKFNLSSNTVLYSLKALEQDGWLSFNEQVFRPSHIEFKCSRHELEAFESKYPALEQIIKTLLRTYEGIFDQQVPVSERLLASLLRQDDVFIKERLIELNRAGIIRYDQKKEGPQLFFIRPRISTKELTINTRAYAERKERFVVRLMQMLEYISDQTSCRSRIIGQYFGDDKIKECGICDNCLKRKASELSTEEFNSLHHRIMNMVKYESLSIADLVEKLQGTRKEKAWKVIEFLQSENKLEVDLAGRVKLK